jgi:hypothetical protein
VRIRRARWSALAVAAGLAACGASPEEARTAIDGLRSAATAIGEGAAALAPAEAAAFESEMSSLQAKLAQEDYSSIVEAEPAVRAKLDAFNRAATERRKVLAAEAAERQAQWLRTSEQTNNMQRALEARMRMLAQQPRLPDNLDREIFTRLGQDFAQGRLAFSDADFAAKSGDYARANVLAKRAQETFENVMRDVGLAPPLAGSAR